MTVPALNQPAGKAAGPRYHPVISGLPLTYYGRDGAEVAGLILGGDCSQLILLVSMHLSSSY
jgi:hypothetical protein